MATLNSAMSPIFGFMFNGGSRDKAVSRLDYCRSVYGDEAVSEWLDGYDVSAATAWNGEAACYTIVREDGSDTTLFNNRIELFLYF